MEQGSERESDRDEHMCRGTEIYSEGSSSWANARERSPNNKTENLSEDNKLIWSAITNTFDSWSDFFASLSLSLSSDLVFACVCVLFSSFRLENIYYVIFIFVKTVDGYIRFIYVFVPSFASICARSSHHCIAFISFFFIRFVKYCKTKIMSESFQKEEIQCETI